MAYLEEGSRPSTFRTLDLNRAFLAKCNARRLHNDVITLGEEWHKHECTSTNSTRHFAVATAMPQRDLQGTTLGELIQLRRAPRGVWCCGSGVVRCGVVRCGVVWCGVVWCGVVRCGAVRCGVVWCGVVWCGVVWCGVAWCVVVWCGVVWCAAPKVLVRTMGATPSRSVHSTCPSNSDCGFVSEAPC